MKGHFFYSSPYELLLLGLVFIGMAFAWLLWLIKGPEKQANHFLGLALFLLSLWLVQVVGWHSWPLKLSLAIGPLLYFYVRQLTKPNRQTSYQDFLHFVPSLVELAVQINGRNFSPVLSCCSTVIYLYLSNRAIIQFYDKEQFQEGDRFRAHLKNVELSLAGLGLWALLSLVYVAVNAKFYSYHLSYTPCYLLLAALLIRMAAMAIIKPVTILVSPVAPPSGSVFRQKSAWLKKTVQNGRYYKDPELSLNTLAEKSLLTTHELSRIINQGLKKNFNDFINEFRVAEVIKKMQNPAFDHFNLAGIAYTCGFNSKSTFHRIFKKLTGKSPAEYKARQFKELPSYKLRPGATLPAVILRHQEPAKRRFMFKNFLKIAFRNFRSNKLSTLINVISLSVGTTAALVIYLIVHFDFSFDRFHTDRDRIYRVVTNFSSAGQESYNAGISGAAIELLKNQLSQINGSARLFMLYQPQVSIPGGQKQTEIKAQDNVILTDDGYFKLFSYHWLAGQAGQALLRPNQVVLTASQARKYFPLLNYGDMLGRTIQYDSLRTTVSGVVADSKGNTDLTFHDFISFATVAVTPGLKTQILVDAFQGITPEQQLFVRLPERTAADKVSAQLNQLYKSRYPQAAGQNNRQSFFLQPLSDLHFNPNYGTYGNGRTANKTNLYELGAIALFLLLMGCINFVNLSTAQSIKRAKEIGIRKTMGSSRGQLILQFIIETLLLTLVTVALSAALAPLLLQAFANFIPAGVNAGLLLKPGVLLFLLLLAVVVALAAGFYPAMILSGYNPVLVLRSQVQSGGRTRSTTLRKSLTVAQFVIAQFFIMATITVSKQIYYALHKDLGFRKEAILIINSPWKDRQSSKVNVFMDKLHSTSQVEQVSAGRDAPMSNDPHSASASYSDGKNEIKVDKIGEKFGDQNYIKVYRIPLLAGRNLQPQDTVNTVLINQNLAQRLGFKNPGDAVGKSLAGFQGKPQTQIVGVVADFHQESIHAPILPLVILTSTNLYFNGTFHIALKPGNWHSAITQIQAVYKQVYPGEDFSYQFFDESISQLYTSEQNTAKLLDWATGFSILISCLGLLGLTIYTANQRQKEIGIRKVMGASVAQMVVLLSSELTLLVMLAFVIATPLAWWAMHQWMQSFAERTGISWWVFIGSGAGMFILAFLTSATQTVKTALANPARSIRT